MSEFMGEALRLARDARGRTSPNPAVGAVVVRDGVIVGQGRTQPAGSWHAEVMALREAGDRARGATMYVTLEPCCHFGRTPPCTDAILAAGIREVHAATVDPNPRVAGGGLTLLRDAGIHTVLGERQDEADAIIAGFSHWIVTGRPLLTAKFAASLDGRIATASGDSRWITGEAARARVHQIRDQIDAIVVGIGTALADDPQLTARPGGAYPSDGRQPLRVVVDSQARLPPTARLLREPGVTLVAHTSGAPAERLAALQAAGAETLACAEREGRVDLADLLADLGRRGCLEVQIEGGGSLLGAAFDAGIVDQVHAYLAPLILGGRNAVPAVAGLGATTVADGWRLNHIEIERLGEDIAVRGRIVNRKT